MQEVACGAFVCSWCSMWKREGNLLPQVHCFVIGVGSRFVLSWWLLVTFMKQKDKYE
jgi:hypothetical protein